MNHNTRNIGSAAADPNTSLPAGEPATQVLCDTCGRSFDTKRGLGVHRRRAHKEEYHRTHVPAPRVKATWSDEELVLLARAEIKLRDVVPSTNDAMALRFSSRSKEGIKGQRNKSARYRAILERLEGEGNGQDEVHKVPL